ncbi:MAG: hypothetical protein H6697_03705 [Myxococcales bacterium]|nr:hypothetical protein [Myxococcales bacterium]
MHAVVFASGEIWSAGVDRDVTSPHADCFTTLDDATFARLISALSEEFADTYRADHVPCDPAIGGYDVVDPPYYIISGGLTDAFPGTSSFGGVCLVPRTASPESAALIGVMDDICRQESCF